MMLEGGFRWRKEPFLVPYAGCSELYLDCIKAHRTGTPTNDEPSMERRADMEAWIPRPAGVAHIVTVAFSMAR